MSPFQKSEQNPPGAGELGTPEQSADSWAQRLRGFGPVGIFIMVAIPVAGAAFIGALLVLVWGHFSRTSWRDIGYVRPPSWIRSIIIGVLFGAVFKLMKVVVMPLLGATPLNQAYQYILGNPAAALLMSAFVIASGGLGEETIYRGFLFERFGKLLRHRPSSTVVTILVTSLWFSLMHYPDQGLAGVEQAMVTGLVFGTIFATTANVFMLMVAHAAFDVVAIAIIYLNLEAKLAHLLFR